jgi:Fe2+ transport system protein FeoA
MLRYLDSLGLRPGVEVMLTDRAPFDGPLTIAVGSTTRQVGAALASRVLVSSSAD